MIFNRSLVFVPFVQKNWKKWNKENWLTHPPLDKMAAILQTIFSDYFQSWMKSFVFWLKFHWSLFSKGPIDNKSALVQVMAWRWTGGKSLLEPMLTQFTAAYMRQLGEMS